MVISPWEEWRLFTEECPLNRFAPHPYPRALCYAFACMCTSISFFSLHCNPMKYIHPMLYSLLCLYVYFKFCYTIAYHSLLRCISFRSPCHTMQVTLPSTVPPVRGVKAYPPPSRIVSTDYTSFQHTIAIHCFSWLYFSHCFNRLYIALFQRTSKNSSLSLSGHKATSQSTLLTHCHQLLFPRFNFWKHILVTLLKDRQDYKCKFFNPYRISSFGQKMSHRRVQWLVLTPTIVFSLAISRCDRKHLWPTWLFSWKMGLWGVRNISM